MPVLAANPNPTPAVQLPMPTQAPIQPPQPEKQVDVSIPHSPAAPTPPAPEPVQPAEFVAPVSPAAPTAADTQTAEPDQEEEAGWQFNQDDAGAPSSNNFQPEGDLNWVASQFTAHEKGAGWYASLYLGGGIFAAIIYFLTKDKITTFIIAFAILAFGLFAARKPHDEQYSLSRQGLLVGKKLYAIHDYKTFSVVDEGSSISIVLMPLKRFMPPLTLYVTAEIEDKVVDFLSAYMPISEHQADALDSLLRRIHF